ncbi:hypothetical protein JMN32_27210 [Fulvivirga sp. 29W222]|uniref:Uncharacterized protein n=1 Tax=Fulvivirga marina TaxID=2494733 RepID=A0A937KHC1_9BACT|nr:hypothetical protein [Fulvivirga marina]MBL6450033.1 hypothetical protein [Fulvivirga marina]
MYKLKKINPADLEKIQVRKQDKILELTGSKFDPAKAYEMVSQETGGFKQEVDKAKEADALFVQLLEREGIALPEDKPKKGARKKSNPETDNRSRIRIQEQERSRAIEIMQLKFKLTA